MKIKALLIPVLGAVALGLSVSTYAAVVNYHYHYHYVTKKDGKTYVHNVNRNVKRVVPGPAPVVRKGGNVHYHYHHYYYHHKN